MRNLRPLSFAGLLALVPALAAQGNLELGKMWTFENPPLAYLEEEYGFKPSQEWLDSLRMASLRYGNGCSASFVSPKGLIMTNHHCARGDIANVSPTDPDWVVNGFYASRMEDEVRLPGLTVQQLVKMADITDAMNQGVTDDMSAAATAAKRAENEQMIMKKAEDAHPGLTPQVVKLHQGAVFQIYYYKVYNDIRLVCSPHLQTGHFGGDPDNFTYPRYSLDFTFCRAYEGDQPADTSKHYFRWSAAGPQANELVFVTGNPGTTDRLRTKAQMDFMRDGSYPIVRELIDNRLAAMRKLASESSEQEQEMRTNILMFENAQKAYKGYHEGLLNEELMAQKVAAEAEFKGKVMADPELAEKFGDCWKELEEVSVLRTAFEAESRFQSPGGSAHLSKAIAIVRAAKASGEDRDRMAGRAKSMPTGMPASARAFFVDHLARAQRWLPKTDPYMAAVLGDRTPEQTADWLESSEIDNVEFVDALIAGGETALYECEDPAIRAAMAIEPIVRANAKKADWLNEQENALGVKIGQALFACYGNSVSPDATFTLRFSDGRVEGFDFNGTIAPFRTSFYGLYGRNAEFNNEYPFHLPQVWLDRMDKVDMTKSVNFVSSNDIIGGNSGSPIVNANLEVVGLIFDGNIEMLANKFVYTDAVPRAVSVHVHGMIEALTKIYDAQRVADELLGK